MFLLLQLNTAALDSGVRGISPLDAALLLLLMFGVPMFPYALFYWSLREKRSVAPETRVHHGPFAKLTAWMHMHHHPQPLHH